MKFLKKLAMATLVTIISIGGLFVGIVFANAVYTIYFK